MASNFKISDLTALGRDPAASDIFIINDNSGAQQYTRALSFGDLEQSLGNTPSGGGLGKPILDVALKGGRSRNDHGTWSQVTGGTKTPIMNWAQDNVQFAIPENAVGCAFLYHVNLSIEPSSPSTTNPYYMRAGYSWPFKAYANVSFRIPGVEFITQNNGLSDPVAKAETNGVSIRMNVNHAVNQDGALYVHDASNMSKFTYFTFPKGTTTLNVAVNVDVIRSGYTKWGLREIRMMMIPFTDTSVIRNLGTPVDDSDDWVTDPNEVDSADDNSNIAGAARATMATIDTAIVDYLDKFPSGDPAYTPIGEDATKLAQIRDDVYELKGGFVFYDVTGDPDPVADNYNPNYGNRLNAKVPVTDAFQVWRTTQVIYVLAADIIGFNWPFETTKQLMAA